MDASKYNLTPICKKSLGKSIKTSCFVFSSAALPATLKTSEAERQLQWLEQELKTSNSLEAPGGSFWQFSHLQLAWASLATVGVC